MATLIVPPGAADYPIAHDTVRYFPYRADHADPASVWLVDVPAEVAAHFLKVGGFAMAKTAEAAKAPAGLVAMRHPEGVGCGYDGRVYTPDSDGVVHVPAEAAAALMAHGFVAVEEKWALPAT